MNEELELGPMNHHFGDSPFPLGKECSCLCWKEVVTLRRVVTILSMKIERHTKMIDEMKISRQRSNTDLLEERDEVESEEYHHHNQSQVIPKNEIESSHCGLEDQQEESHFDFKNMCETSMLTEAEEVTEFTVYI